MDKNLRHIATGMPEFRLGDKVVHFGNVCEIIATDYEDDLPYCIVEGRCTQWVAERDLELYTE